MARGLFSRAGCSTALGTQEKGPWSCATGSRPPSRSVPWCPLAAGAGAAQAGWGFCYCSGGDAHSAGSATSKARYDPGTPSCVAVGK